MTTAVHVLPKTERPAEDHSFVGLPLSTSTLFSGWGPRL
jgi:hypothetical protein